MRTQPSLGTPDDLHRLVREAHRRGLKVILDLVADHTAWDNPWIAEHPDWYKHDAQGSIVPPNDAWKDVAGLDYSHLALRAAMIAVMQFWLRTFDVDGFRCDAAGLVPTDFWEQARMAVNKIKPDALMLAESDSPALQARAFDLDYDWPLLRTLGNVMTQGAPASEIRRVWEKGRTDYPARALHLRISDDHDEERATVKFGPSGALAASALMLTLDGVPLLYNGMEVGDTGKWSKIDWAGAQARPQLLRFYQGMLALRRAHPALRQGALRWLPNSDPAHLLTFVREAGREQFLVIINLSGQTVAGRVDAPNTPKWRDVTPDGDSKETPPTLQLPAWGFRVFQRQ